MNHTPDASTAAGNGGDFDPHQAAALLDQTTQQARRKLAPSPPWLLATRAVAVLAVCGAVWLSVRGQHPYRGPTAAVIPVLVAFIVLNFGATVAVRERAIAGVRGVARLRPAEITVMVLAWAAVPVLIWAMAAAGCELRPAPNDSADHPRPGLGGHHGGTRKLGRVRLGAPLVARFFDPDRFPVPQQYRSGLPAEFRAVCAGRGSGGRCNSAGR